MKSVIHWRLGEKINMKLIRMYAGQRGAIVHQMFANIWKMLLALLLQTARPQQLFVIHVHIPVLSCSPLHLCEVCCCSLMSCGNVNALGSD